MKVLFSILLIVSSFAFGQFEPPSVQLPEMEKPKGPDWYNQDFIYEDATFLGGALELKNYLRSYDPSKTKDWADSSFNKRGYISFIVEIDGSTSEIKMLRGISPEADSLAIELITTMPKWNPAENKDGPIQSKVRLPITFMKSEE